MHEHVSYPFEYARRARSAGPPVGFIPDLEGDEAEPASLQVPAIERPRERMITILLLALAIPCSAQLGVVLGMPGSVSFTAVLIWALAMVGGAAGAGAAAAGRGDHRAAALRARRPAGGAGHR